MNSFVYLLQFVVCYAFLTPRVNPAPLTPSRVDAPAPAESAPPSSSSSSEAIIVVIGQWASPPRDSRAPAGDSAVPSKPEVRRLGVLRQTGNETTAYEVVLSRGDATTSSAVSEDGARGENVPVADFPGNLRSSPMEDGTGSAADDDGTLDAGVDASTAPAMGTPPAAYSAAPPSKPSPVTDAFVAALPKLARPLVASAAASVVRNGASASAAADAIGFRKPQKRPAQLAQQGATFLTKFKKFRNDSAGGGVVETTITKTLHANDYKREGTLPVETVGAKRFVHKVSQATTKDDADDEDVVLDVAPEESPEPTPTPEENPGVTRSTSPRLVTPSPAETTTTSSFSSSSSSSSSATRRPAFPSWMAPDAFVEFQPVEDPIGWRPDQAHTPRWGLRVPVEGVASWPRRAGTAPRGSRVFAGSGRAFPTARPRRRRHF